MENGRMEENWELIRFTTLIDDMWKGFKKFFIGLILLIAACASLYYVRAVRSYVPIYTASSSFIINYASAYGYSTSYNNQNAAKQMSVTFPYIMTSGALSDIVIEDLGLGYLPGSISASAKEGTKLFTISVT